MIDVYFVAFIVLVFLVILVKYQSTELDLYSTKTGGVVIGFSVLLVTILYSYFAYFTDINSKNLGINIPSITGITNTIMKRYIAPLRGRGYCGRSSREHRFAMKNGGELGGIQNDGNTCFMNSVIQAIASSREILKFVENQTNKNNQYNGAGGEFTEALDELLVGVNGKYGLEGKEFSTRGLLQKMPNGPKQNFFLGYNQEDAQEFYQLVFNLLEKEQKRQNKLKKIEEEGVDDASVSDSDSDASSGSGSDTALSRDEIPDFITGNDNIGHLGQVYVPAEQVDPNREDKVSKYFHLDLMTPVDGLTAERVGCLVCGENGGIRYSVNSGLSLNLPNKSVYSYDITQLLDDWIAPEIIEDVNCNRCGLLQTLDFLKEKLEGAEGKLKDVYEIRVNEIELQLNKHQISDEVFEKLSIKQMIKKTRKLKQIVLSRPPPLLAIHINRSVFDPRSYQIVKNGCPVTFPAVLDLNKYVAGPDQINTDARLPLKNSTSSVPSNGSISHLSNGEKEQDSEQDVDVDADVDVEVNGIESKEIGDADESQFKYELKSVISHYGTHNYGHYICYRKLRGTWWRISDENVYVVSEEEVINLQGTFMLFYEYNNGETEELLQLSDNESDTEEIMDSDDAESDSSDEDDDDDVDVDKKDKNVDEDGNKTHDSESQDDRGVNGVAHNQRIEENEEIMHSRSELDEYNAEESRAFHI